MRRTKFSRQDYAETIYQRVLLSRDLLVTITAYQRDGIYEDMFVFTSLSSILVYTHTNTNFDLVTTLHRIDAIFTPWLVTYGLLRLPKLFACIVDLPSLAMLYAAATANHMLLHYLRENCDHRLLNRYDPLDTAAFSNNLILLQDLRQQGFSSSTKAMELAAGHGNLDMIRHIHANRPVQCTTTAVENAVSGGHVAVVAYFWQHLLPNASFYADHKVDLANRAAESNQLGMVQSMHNWVWYGNNVGFHSAIKRGNIAVAKWIHAQAFFWGIVWWVSPMVLAAENGL
ncbi:hypothetical protein As57867_006956, partial [Aphanomyces stellatus]